MPTPGPFFRCLVCKRAGRVGEPFKRNSSSLLINDASALFDCGEGIGDSLNRRNIQNVVSLFITHWHPGHTCGLRPLLDAFVNLETDKPNKQVTVYIPTRVFKA
ncbi:MAG TPA: MBL fold metallo-hydrolase [Candidatus Bathyarchaeia archaeon]|nr:MBL fold metallo-hydrolase [Candidatus Bathyarchaeia archaeon]